MHGDVLLLGSLGYDTLDPKFPTTGGIPQDSKILRYPRRSRDPKRLDLSTHQDPQVTVHYKNSSSRDS